MKRIDWGLVLATIGAFALLFLLIVFHPISCASTKHATHLTPSRQRTQPGLQDLLDSRFMVRRLELAAPRTAASFERTRASSRDFT